MTTIPTDLPANPMVLLQAWTDHAWKNAGVPNPNAMALSSVALIDNVAYPSSRIVLLKEFVAEPGYVVFYTNYQSRKGQELDDGMRACAVLHWDHLGQQVRFEGIVKRMTEQHSDRYFSSRDREARIGAWTSDQSQPLDTRADLLRKHAAMSARFSAGETIPRPPHWGGISLMLDRLELWCGGEYRLHDRALWQRRLVIDDDEVVPGPWSGTRLQP